MSCSRRLPAALAITTALGLGGAALAATRRIRRAQQAHADLTKYIAPDLRPWFGALPLEAFAGIADAPPQRGGRSERVMEKLHAGLGERIIVPGHDGGPDVPVHVYDPPRRHRPSGAVLWIHGGGMIVGGPWMDHGLCNRIAKELGVLVISVDYRLAPEHPFPAGPEDCCAALEWLHGHAEELGVDPGLVAVGGESAGGGLAAVLAQMAHDRGLPLAFQALVYPMLEDRTALVDRGEAAGRVVWTPQANRSAWGWYLGHPVTEDEPRPYASAARREDLTGLPPAWIGVGTVDLFHAEDLEYAERLQGAGVPVEFVEMEGMPHAADVFQFVPRMREFRSSLLAALGRAVGNTRPVA